MKPELGLKGRVVVVAGAGGDGIGSATTQLLAQAGAHVVAIDRYEEAMDGVRAQLEANGSPHRIEHADLSVDGAADEVVARVERDFGPISGVVNVVGGFENMDQLSPLLSEGAQEIFARLLNFNLGPTLAMSIAAARVMKAQRRSGSIVQITSSTGLVSMPYGAGYAAAKAALQNLTRTMAVEWGCEGIRVNAVACGTIMSAEARRWAEGIEEAARGVVPLGRCGEPDEIAGAVIFLLGDLASYVSGIVLSVDGGALARAPYNDRDDLPVFITDEALRSRLARLK